MNVRVGQVMSICRARSRFSALVDRLPAGGPVLVTKNGDPAAVILDPHDYDRMVSTLEVLGKPELRDAIEDSLQDVAVGQVELIPHASVKRRLAERRSCG